MLFGLLWCRLIFFETMEKKLLQISFVRFTRFCPTWSNGDDIELHMQMLLHLPHISACLFAACLRTFETSRVISFHRSEDFLSNLICLVRSGITLSTNRDVRRPLCVHQSHNLHAPYALRVSIFCDCFYLPGENAI